MAKLELYGIDTTVIGLTGKARSGKDTAALMLAAELRDRVDHVHIRAMAGTLKSMLIQLFEAAASPEADPAWSSLQCVNGELKEKPHRLLDKSPREMMQTLGTDWGRKMICEDIWIRIMRNKIERLAYEQSMFNGGGTMAVIIPDIRYANEGTLCDTIIRIVRNEAPSVAAHVSEAGIPAELVSLTIANNEDLAALEKKLVAAANIICKEEALHARSKSNAA